MTFLQDFHGAIALVLLCGLLFLEEAGVPLLFAPGDLILISAGLLIATGGLDPRLFVPLATLSCLGGALVGYTWAHRLGEPALRSLAARLGAEQALDRVLRRIRGAGPLDIAIARLIPGLRVYTTLGAGVAGVPLQAFVPGLIGATIVWIAALTTIGALAGLPAERLLSRFEKLAFQGVVLALVGLLGYLVIRRAPAAARTALAQLPPRVRAVLAALLNAGILAAVAAGVLAIGRRLLQTSANVWIEPVTTLGLLLLLALVVGGRRLNGSTRLTRPLGHS